MQACLIFSVFVLFCVNNNSSNNNNNLLLFCRRPVQYDCKLAEAAGSAAEHSVI